METGVAASTVSMCPLPTKRQGEIPRLPLEGKLCPQAVMRWKAAAKTSGMES
jgi:hypothetical protein